MATFNERLKELRTERYLTQKELAKRVGMNWTTISDYERGDNTDPYMRTLRKLAGFFDVTIEYLTGESNVREAHPAKKLGEEVSQLDEQTAKQVLQYIKFLKSGGGDNAGNSNI